MFLLFPTDFCVRVNKWYLLVHSPTFPFYFIYIALQSLWNYGVLLVCLKADNETEVQRGHYRLRIMQLFRFLVHFFIYSYTLYYFMFSEQGLQPIIVHYICKEKNTSAKHIHTYCLTALIFLIVFWFDCFYPGLICFWLVDCFGLMVFTQPLFIVCS